MRTQRDFSSRNCRFPETGAIEGISRKVFPAKAFLQVEEIASTDSKGACQPRPGMTRDHAELEVPGALPAHVDKPLAMLYACECGETSRTPGHGRPPPPFATPCRVPRQRDGHAADAGGADADRGVGLGRSPVSDSDDGMTPGRPWDVLEDERREAWQNPRALGIGLRSLWRFPGGHREAGAVAGVAIGPCS
jgi:hypothetical protein